MKRTLLLLVVATMVIVGAVVAGARQTPSATTNFIEDERGLSLVQHGFSLANSVKSAPDSLPVFSEADLDRERADVGTNFVRMLILWSAVEPEPGVYDTAYLAEIEKRVAWYAKRGYHVMLDMHQDLWGPAISPDVHVGWGNGAPEWATHLDGLPVKTNDMWELVYLEPGVIRAFDNFWNTSGKHPELMQHYAAAWRAVAEHFAGNSAVVAYDLMNEPYGGTLQGVAFESGPLTKLYQMVTDSIREVDDETWLCVEPQAFGFNWGLPSALGAVHDPRADSPRVAFCPHLYPLPMDLGDGYVGTSRTIIDGTVDLWVGNVLRTAARLGQDGEPVPVILGEFGLNTDGTGAEDYVKLVYETADKHGFGVAYWSRDSGSWGPYTDDGSPRNLISWLNRPYPLAVEGLVAWGSDEKQLSVKMAPSGYAEIYVPRNTGESNSAQDHSAPVVEGGSIEYWDAATGKLRVTADGEGEIIISHGPKP